MDDECIDVNEPPGVCYSCREIFPLAGYWIVVMAGV